MRSTLENFSDKNEESKRVNPAEKIVQEGSDIEFDEKIDIDELQKTLLEQIKKEDDGLITDNKATTGDETPTEISENPQKNEISEEEQKEQSITPTIPKDIQDVKSLEETSALSAKKYVIYIEPENIPLMEKLSIQERKLVVNNVLAEQDERLRARKIEEAKQRHFKHVIISVLTFIIGVPMMFLLINKSVIVTITNYTQARQNFEKLYRAHGKIQPNLNLVPDSPKI